MAFELIPLILLLVDFHCTGLGVTPRQALYPIGKNEELIMSKCGNFAKCLECMSHGYFRQVANVTFDKGHYQGRMLRRISAPYYPNDPKRVLLRKVLIELSEHLMNYHVYRDIHWVPFFIPKRDTM